MPPKAPLCPLRSLLPQRFRSPGFRHRRRGLSVSEPHTSVLRQPHPVVSLFCCMLRLTFVRGACVRGVLFFHAVQCFNIWMCLSLLTLPLWLDIWVVSGLALLQIRLPRTFL